MNIVLFSINTYAILYALVACFLVYFFPFVDLCPVGALTSKPYAFMARPWELRFAIVPCV